MAGVQPEPSERPRGPGDGEGLGVVPPGDRGQQAVVLQLHEGLLVERRGLQQLGAAQPDLRRLGPDGAGPGDAVALGGVQMVLDHAQRKVAVTLGGEDVAQALDVGVGELAVSRGRALGLDEPLALEKADLGDGDVGEVAPQDLEDFPDAHERPGRLRAHHRSSSPTREEHQPELADLDFVAAGER